MSHDDLAAGGTSGLSPYLHFGCVSATEAVHAADANTPGGTYLNDERVTRLTPLKSGDVIRVGNSVIEFGERQKRN